MSNGLPSTFDVASYRGGGPSSPSTVGVRCSTPDPGRYHDPRTQGFESLEQGGKTLLQAAGRRFGIDGVVVPRATFGGASPAVDHDRPGTVVIDPDDRGRGLEVDLARFDKARALRVLPMVDRVAADEAAAAAVEGRPMSQAEQLRLKSAAFYHVMAQPEAPPAPAPAATPAAAPRTSGEAARAASPVANLSAAFERPAPAGAGRAAATTVTFGIGGEDIPASYTTVTRVAGARPGTGMLVLGSDGPTFYPKGTRPFVGHVAGADAVLQLEATGIRFAHAGETLAIYMVTCERPL